MMKEIRGFFGEYRWLSNFWPAPVKMYGLEYPTVEHAYQAAKTLDEEEREFIRLQSTPGKAKRAGKTITVREDWETFKVGAMKILLERKFSIPHLKEKLLATGDALLVEENDWGDTFWGECRGTGQNILGKLLMEIRESLKNEVPDHGGHARPS